MPLRYHTEEIVLVIELLIQGYYLRKRSSTYGENFYGFIRSPIGIPWMGRRKDGLSFSKRYVLITLFFETVLPYLKQRILRMIS